MNGAKMVSGLLARTGAGAWVRAVALAAMAWGTWEAGVWAAGFVKSAPDGAGAAVIAVGIAQAIAAVITLANSTRDLKGDTARAPFVCLDSMTDGGREVPLWALLAGPLVLPAEVLISAVLAVAWVVVAVGKVLNWKVRSAG